MTRSSWHVLISTVDYRVVFLSCPQAYTLHSLRCPKSLISSAAEAVYDGLFRLATVGVFTEFDRKVMELAKYTFHHFDRDGAGTNEKVLAFRKSLLPDAFITDHTCCNHHISLVESAVIGSHFVKLISSFLSAAILVRQGAYFLRLVHAVTEAKWNIKER